MAGNHEEIFCRRRLGGSALAQTLKNALRPAPLRLANQAQTARNLLSIRFRAVLFLNGQHLFRRHCPYPTYPTRKFHADYGFRKYPVRSYISAVINLFLFYIVSSLVRYDLTNELTSTNRRNFSIFRNKYRPISNNRFVYIHCF